MRNKKSISIFMIMLIVTLPFYSVNIFGSMQIEEVNGQKAINNIGFKQEFNKAQITITSTKDDIVCACNPGLDLTCSNINGSNSCVYNDPFIGVGSSNYYTFYSKSDDSDYVTATVYTDKTKPEFTLFNIEKIEDKYQFRFNLRDYGIADGNLEGCSGIKKVEIFANGVSFGATNYSSGIGNCTLKNGRFELTPNFNDGPIRLSAEAYDYLGNYVIISEDIYHDLSAPDIKGVSLIFAGREIEFVSSSTIKDVSVKIRVNEHNMSVDYPSEITADLSALNINPASSSSMKNVNFKCVKDADVDNYYDCLSDKIQVLTGTGTADLIFETTDIEGNSKTQNFPFSIQMDPTRPVIEDIGTKNCNYGIEQCYLHKGENWIVTKIANEGEGFLNRWLFLSGSSLGMNSPRAASKCEKVTDGLWTCQHLITNLDSTSGSTHTVSTDPRSADDIMNFIEPKQVSFLYDDNPPKKSSDVIFKQKTSNKEFVKSFDKLQILLESSDDLSGVKTAFADLSGVVNGKTWVEGSCYPNEDKFLCSWDAGSVVAGPKEEEVEIVIVDFAGNNATLSANLVIYESLNSSVNFWKVQTALPDPSVIDINLAPYLPEDLNIWVGVYLRSTTNNVNLLHTALKGSNCKVESGPNILGEGTRIYNVHKGKANDALVTMVIPIKKDLPDNIDKVGIKCQLELSSAVENSAYKPETVDLSFNLGLKRGSLDLPQNYVEKIDKIKTELQDSAWIDSVNTWLGYANKLCTVFKLITKFIQAWHLIKNLYMVVMGKYQFTKAYAEAMKTETAATNEMLGGTITEAGSWVCGFLDCTLMDKLVDQYGNENTFMKSYMRWINIYILSLGKGSTDPEKIKKAFDGELRGKDVSTWEASKKSILVSTLTLCVPGILHNINKARQIDCMYVDCAQRWTSAGLNPYTCEAMRANSYCNFVYGQLFHAIPFSGILDSIGGMLETFSSNAWAAVGMIFGAACWVMAEFPGNEEGFSICEAASNVNNIVNFFSGTIRQAMGIFDDGGQKDYCKEVLDDE